jgi:hypothetical protein
MRFFVPQARGPEQEQTYQSIIAALKDQLRWPISPRRIYSIQYHHDKKTYAAAVGTLEPLENRYEILAILESNFYLIFTRLPNGAHGVTILVSKDEILEIEDFS